MRLGSLPVDTELVTLHFEQDREVSTPALGALTEPVHVAGNAGRYLDDTVRLLTTELAHPQIGTTSAVNSIIDLLLVQFVRAWLATQPAQRQSPWLAGLLDPVVCDAMARIHQEPHRPWTTATLAAAISVSRATLSRRFPAAVGQTPGANLTRWRMDLAAVRLRDTDEPIERIAGAVGYTSPHAFSRAFRRARSMAPGEYRAHVRQRAGADAIAS